MDGSRITGGSAASEKPAGAYTSLDDLIRIQFKARDFSFLPRQPVSSILSGRYASRLRGRGLNFEELRRYRPDDDIRTMDWKVTARTRIPHVRVYTEEKDRVVLLVVDQRINMFFGTRERMKSVTAAEVAALGAWRGLDAGDRVGAVVFNDGGCRVFRPQRSRQTVMAILGAVVDMNHALKIDDPVDSDPGRLNQALEQAHRLAPHDALVVVISDFDGVDDRTTRLVTRIATHNDVIGILTHDSARLNPGRHPIVVSDGALQFELNYQHAKTREKVVDAHREDQERITRILHRLSAPLLMVGNRGDVVTRIRELLGVPGAPGERDA